MHGRNAETAIKQKLVERDWTRGSISANLFSLSWPMVVGGTLNMLGPTIDMIWVGRLGEASIAGVGVSGMVVQVVNSLTMGLFTGMRAMIARYVGAGDTEGANHIAQQAFVLGVAFSLIMAVIGIFLAEPILIMLGVGPDVVSEGAAYLRINCIGMVTMTFRMLTEATMQASGDAIRPMMIAIFFRLFHIALCPFLVFGWWIFPHLGVSGAALTNVLSQALGAGIGMWFLFAGYTRLSVTLRGFKFDPGTIWRMVKIGIPASVTGMERTFGQLALMWLVVPFGTLAVAAHTVGQRVDQFVNNPVMAFGQAAGILAGQNLGAQELERAKKTGWTAVAISSSIMLLASGALLLWAEQAASVFTSSQDLIGQTGVYIRIQVVGYTAFGFTMVLSQVLNGVGDTLPVMLFALLGMWVVQVPVAFLLSRYTDVGVAGVWWGMVAGVLVRAVIYLFYFRAGKWKTKKV
jgi:putative MATE family efflux protein